MKQPRQEVIDDILSGFAHVVRCQRIERRDGKTFHYTEHDKDLEMVDTGEVYQPSPAVLPDTAISYDTDANAATVDLEGALDGDELTRSEFAAGIWDFARVFIFKTIWTDPREDDVPVLMGKLGEAVVKEVGLTIRMAAVGKELENSIGIKTSITCRAQLGDSQCKVRLDPPTWSANTAVSVRPEEDAGKGSVVKPSTENGAYFKCITAGTTGSSEPNWDSTIGSATSDGSAVWEAIRAHKQSGTVQSVTDNGEFTGNLGFPDDWFGGGEITFTSGENKGVSREVQGYVGDTYTLWVTMPFVVEVGDEFVATAGCRKRLQPDCIDKHDNNLNMRAEPFAAGPAVFSTFGGQNGS